MVEKHADLELPRTNQSEQASSISANFGLMLDKLRCVQNEG